MSKPSSQRQGGSKAKRLQVSVVNHCRGLRVDRELLTKAVRLAARRHGMTSGLMELAVFSDSEISRLHKQYFGKRTTTDVISFDLGEPQSSSRNGPQTLQASLALGGQVARRQAKLHRTSINKELALYAVHGLLHLLGYNDAAARQAEQMHEAEDQLLSELGIGPVFESGRKK
jgi:probable rRNA maturation factor